MLVDKIKHRFLCERKAWLTNSICVQNVQSRETPWLVFPRPLAVPEVKGNHM